MKKLIAKYIPLKLKTNEGLTIISIALMMLIIEFYGWQIPYIRYFANKSIDPNKIKFNAQVYTSISFAVCFFLIPLLLNILFPIMELKNIGLSFPKKYKETFKLYAPLIIIMVPIIYIACMRPSFNKFYPLYRPKEFKMLLIYELIYLTQFISVEFFFRGFGLFRLEKMLPGFGVLIMVIPYSFIHIHKPFPEAVGSIVAGVILGNLALKSKSIWPGVAVHACIAFSADIFSLYHSGELASLVY